MTPTLHKREDGIAACGAGKRPGARTVALADGWPDVTCRRCLRFYRRSPVHARIAGRVASWCGADLVRDERGGVVVAVADWNLVTCTRCVRAREALETDRPGWGT